MKLTIGMACYDNRPEVWFTVESLRLHHDLTDCEILVVDNYGDKKLESWINYWCSNNTRYVKCNDISGTAPAKQKVFENAQGDFVICMDSHILLKLDAIKLLKAWIDQNPASPHLYHGPMIYDNLYDYVDHQTPVMGKDGVWGQWGPHQKALPSEPYEIPQMGMGIFGCFRDQWLGFNPAFYGFGGEEGYIAKKYQLAGRKVMMLPFLAWVHRFKDIEDETPPYPCFSEDRIRNYLIGFQELGLDEDILIQRYGLPFVNKVKASIE